MNMKKALYPLGYKAFLLAAGEGFEPSQTESESGVLPLHKPAICRSEREPRSEQILLYKKFRTCQPFFKKMQRILFLIRPQTIKG